MQDGSRWRTRWASVHSLRSLISIRALAIAASAEFGPEAEPPGDAPELLQHDCAHRDSVAQPLGLAAGLGLARDEDLLDAGGDLRGLHVVDEAVDAGAELLDRHEALRVDGEVERTGHERVAAEVLHRRHVAAEQPPGEHAAEHL